MIIRAADFQGTNTVFFPKEPEPTMLLGLSDKFLTNFPPKYSQKPVSPEICPYFEPNHLLVQNCEA